MKFLRNKFFAKLSKFSPFFIFVLLIIIFFWKVFFLNQVPLPADLVVGAYFPWLDYKWGYDVGVPVKNLITSDVVSVIYPLRSYMVDLIKRGDSPLWNPLVFGGYPLLANLQLAIFSPTTLFYLFLPTIKAWTIQIILQPLLSMTFSYLLLRHLKLNKLSSIFGSVIYAFSGFSIIWMEWGAHALTAAFLPLIIYFVSRLVEEKNNNSNKILFGIGLSISVAMQIFSGYPQLFVYTLLSIFLYCVLVLRDHLYAKNIIYLVLFIFLGLALTAIQLVPAFELLSLSQRVSENLSYDLIYLPWQNLIGFLAPDFFGNHATGNFWGIGNYTNNVGYTGVVSLSLAVFAIFNIKRNKLVQYLFITLSLSLLLSLPFPWSVYLYSLNLPGIGASSLTRILVITNFSLAFLAAFGLDHLTKIKSNGLAIITTIINLILFSLFIFSHIQFKNNNIHFLVAIRNLVYPIIFVSITFILSILINKYLNYKKLLLLIIATVGIFELFRFGWKYTPFSNANLVFPNTPITDYLKNSDDIFRTHFGEVIPMNMWSSFELSSISGYDAVYPLTIAKYVAAANANLSSTSPMGRHGSFDNISSRLFDLSNNKYLLALKRNQKTEPSPNGVFYKKYDLPKFKKVFEDGSVAILENKDVLPRIFFVSSWEVIKNDSDVLNRLIDTKFDIKNKIIIQEDFKEFGVSKKLPKYEINNVIYKSLKISFDINSDLDGFIFISDTYYPGWEVFVDGKEKEIYKADYTFRAVPILKGEHNILFIYNPKSFRIGRLISAISLSILIILTIYGYKKNR